MTCNVFDGTLNLTQQTSLQQTHDDAHVDDDDEGDDVDVDVCVSR